jgi:hypothetical protein
VAGGGEGRVGEGLVVLTVWMGANGFSCAGGGERRWAGPEDEEGGFTPKPARLTAVRRLIPHTKFHTAPHAYDFCVHLA